MIGDWRMREWLFDDKNGKKYLVQTLIIGREEEEEEEEDRL